VLTLMDPDQECALMLRLRRPRQQGAQKDTDQQPEDSMGNTTA